MDYMPVGERPSVSRRLKVAWRRAREAMPSLPGLPAAERVLEWWREVCTYKYFPSLPSPKMIRTWWHTRRRDGFLPTTRELPSPRGVIKGIREQSALVRPPHITVRGIRSWWHTRRRDGFLPTNPQVPSAREVIKGIREQSALVQPPRIPFREEEGNWQSARPTDRRRRLVIGIVLLIAALCLKFAGPPAWHLVKKIRARRMAAQATELTDQQQFSQASKKMRAAFDLNQTDLVLWQANAHLLSAMRQPAAIEWWERIAQSRTLTLQDERDYAAAALAVKEVSLAAQHIAKIVGDKQDVPAIDSLLIGQLAVLRGENAKAVEEAEKVLLGQNVKAWDQLAANLLIVTGADRGSAAYLAAAARIAKIAWSSQGSVSLEALTVLARQFVALPPSDLKIRSLSIPTPDVPAGAVSPDDVADRLEARPEARPFHRMLALELRALTTPDDEDKLFASAIEKYRDSDDETLAALGAWLYTRGRFELILELLPVERAAENRDLLIERIDALAATGRFKEAREMLSTKEYAVLPQTFQHMYLAVVYARLNESRAFENEWLRALENADSVQTLLALAKFALRYNKPQIAQLAYGRATIKQPGLRVAYVERLRVLELNGPTNQAASVAAEIAKLWPGDSATRVHEIYLRLLLTRSIPAAISAEQECGKLVSNSPWEGLARSALALARLKQGKPAAALEAFEQARTDLPSTDVSWPVYTAVLYANGWKDQARAEAKKLSTVKMLPEERELIAEALADNS